MSERRIVYAWEGEVQNLKTALELAYPYVHAATAFPSQAGDAKRITDIIDRLLGRALSAHEQSVRTTHDV